MRRDDDPISILTRDHGTVRTGMDSLQRAVAEITAEGFSCGAFGRLAESIRRIDTSVRAQSEREEQFLLPLLERHHTPAVRSMRAEHRELWHACGRLLKTVEDVEEGRIHGTVLPELVEVARSVIDLVTAHIVKETDVYFPLAETVLTDEEYGELRRQLKTPTMSAGAH